MLLNISCVQYTCHVIQILIKNWSCVRQIKFMVQSHNPTYVLLVCVWDYLLPDSAVSRFPVADFGLCPDFVFTCCFGTFAVYLIWTDFWLLSCFPMRYLFYPAVVDSGSSWLQICFLHLQVPVLLLCVNILHMIKYSINGSTEVSRLSPDYPLCLDPL